MKKIIYIHIRYKITYEYRYFTNSLKFPQLTLKRTGPVPSHTYALLSWIPLLSECCSSPVPTMEAYWPSLQLEL